MVFRSLLLLGLSGLAFLLASASARAQSPSNENPRIRAELGQLSHVLGGAHYLRIACNGRSDQRWRLLMVSLLDREGPPGDPKREDMIAAFNDGYRAHESRFPRCTAAARAEEADLRVRGETLARNLASARPR